MISLNGKDRGEFPRWPRIIFMGTPEFAVPSLRGLIESGHNVLAAVTQPDRPKGRGRKVVASPVKRVATEHQIEVFQPERASDPEFCELVRRKRPDLLIVVAFGQILRDHLLNMPRWGAVNVHASLLPKYRGAAPIHWAILNKETKSGLTAMRMDTGLDTGPVLMQEEIEIGENETGGHLHERLSILSQDFLLKTLKGLEEGRLKERPQDHARATYAPKIGRAMSLVSWDRSAQDVSALIRALDPWPGVLTTIQGKEVKLFSSRIVDGAREDTVPGRVIRHKAFGVGVETGRGVIEIGELQIPGKKRLTADEFLRGVPLEEGMILGG